MRILVAVSLLCPAALLAPAGATSAGRSYDFRVAGVEVPPITSSLGTFVGGAAGGIVGAWRIQIAHQPLRTGPTVAITGGTFSIRLQDAERLAAPVVGGSVSVLQSGARCTNQVYAVAVQLTTGAFSGTLTHRRRSLLNRCLIYAATITGHATLTA